MQTLQSLPTELLILIGENIYDLKTLSNLCRVNRLFSVVLNPLMHCSVANSEYAVHAIACAAVAKSKEMLHLLLENGISTTITIDSRAIQYKAWKERNEDVLDKIIAEGANITISRRFEGIGHFEVEMPALNWAAMQGHVQMVQMLLRNGARVSHMDMTGMTALHHAANMEYDMIVSLLLENGAQTNSFRTLPLNMAMLRRSIATVKSILIYQTVSVAYTRDGMMPLHAAATLPGDDITPVKQLLERAACINTRNNEGNTALTLAAHYGNENIFQLLLDKGAVVDENTLSLVGQHRYHNQHLNFGTARLSWLSTMTDKILENSPVTLRDNLGKTPLHMAAEHHKKDLALSLLMNGADVNAQNRDGVRPLDIAILHESVDMVNILIQYGAKINAQECY